MKSRVKQKENYILFLLLCRLFPLNKKTFYKFSRDTSSRLNKRWKTISRLTRKVHHRKKLDKWYLRSEKRLGKCLCKLFFLRLFRDFHRHEGERKSLLNQIKFLTYKRTRVKSSFSYETRYKLDWVGMKFLMFNKTGIMNFSWINLFLVCKSASRLIVGGSSRAWSKKNQTFNKLIHQNQRGILRNCTENSSHTIIMRRVYKRMWSSLDCISHLVSQTTQTIFFTQFSFPSRSPAHIVSRNSRNSSM